MLTIEEARRLLDVIKDDRLEAFWVCALTLGLRRGELLGLRWDDVDFANGLLAVRQTLQRADGSLQFVDPKTDRSRRVVPAPEPTLAVLRKHKRAQAAEQLAAGKRWQNFGSFSRPRSEHPSNRAISAPGGGLPERGRGSTG
ncbi:site-specific integrase [Nonomuraea fuscirosea]|uniref:site-specific integrase n=1 Tax=Nonomuraea fuscirosea TaxID=1291556 RepID=UPI001C62AF20|nr:site-specific integrase [Nonomuraea fuscirosea]